VSTAPESRTTPLRVLLVEDDADDALLCRHAIDRSGLPCTLHVTGTLREAVDHLDRQGADVALLDLSLPDAEHLDAVTTLAQRYTDLPIVVLTGLRDEQAADSALHAGAQDYLIKGLPGGDGMSRAVRYAIERKRLELNYRRLFDTNPYPMYVFDTQTLAFLEVNDAAVAYYGYDRQEFLATDLTRLCLAEDVPALTGAVAAAGAVERWGPLRQVKRDRAVVEVTITSHVLPFKSRAARCAVVEDITEKEQLEQRLRQSQRLESLGQLAGGVAHDFNNLLGIIIGYASVCVQDLEAPPADSATKRLHNDLQEILGAAQRAANLTRQLLSFARAEVAQTQVIDLHRVIAGVEQMLRRTIGEDIELQIHLSPEPQPIKADPGQIEQVLLNLVVNARDAMPDGGTICIDTRALDADERYAAYHPGLQPGRYVCLDVSDTGTGMSQATLDRAFEPFFTTKPTGQGTGLGLSTIYGIVTQAGGHTQISSVLGTGTTVTVLFPVTREPSVAPQPAAGDDRNTSSHGEVILLVEDEECLRRLTDRILTSHGYTVIAAGNGPEAIELANHAPTQRIDLLLTDVIMPHMNGRDLATRLRALLPALPTVYMSGYAEPHFALPSDATLLPKPFTEQQILTTVRHALDG
jgi:PAS domain S-box-containing protein